MNTKEYLALTGLVGWGGMLIYAWIMAAQKTPRSWVKRLAITGGFTLLVVIAVIGLAAGSGFAVQLGAVSYKIENWHIKSQITDPLAHLYTRLPNLRAYLQKIQNDIEPLMAETDLVPNDWEADMKRQAAREDTGFHLQLWRETASTISRSVTCNIRLYDQFLTTAINPTITIDLPQEHLRLDWFVNTGDDGLDAEILAIIQEITAAWRW